MNQEKRLMTLSIVAAVENTLKQEDVLQTCDERRTQKIIAGAVGEIFNLIPHDEAAGGRQAMRDMAKSLELAVLALTKLRYLKTHRPLQQ